jgi:hypothetical protein
VGQGARRDLRRVEARRSKKTLSLFERGRNDLYLRAELYLAARGVEATPETIAGAMLEAERDAMIVAFLTKK